LEYLSQDVCVTHSLTSSESLLQYPHHSKDFLDHSN
jgi:hypothetical protein